MTILLIEDSQHDALYLQDLLSHAGYVLTHLVSQADFHNAFARLSAAERERTVIIADLFMPGSDGFELIRDLAAEGVTTPVILISGNDAQFLAMAMELGRSRGLNIIDAIAKPVDADRLVGHLRQLGLPASGIPTGQAG
ncbi:response regulator [Ferrovibrio sp.]|uniref:response regulator transcription factor n=1 Tax=Ferrovibrio sp. TaxID=1917215 RepID=UPI00311E75C6